MDGGQPIECSVKTCRNQPDVGFKMCQRCRNAEAKRAVKKRQRKRAQREANGEFVKTRAPNRPKPPLFRIPSSTGGFQIYTRLDWEHLDKTLFSDELFSDRPLSEYLDTVDLIPIKICSRKGCHQPVPFADPRNACGFCRQRNSNTTKVVAGVKRKRDDGSNITDRLLKYFDNDNSSCEDLDSFVNDMEELVDKYSCSTLVPVFVAMLDKPEKVKLALNALYALADDSYEYSFSQEIDVILDHILRLLSDNTCGRNAADVIIDLFHNELVRTSSRSQVDGAIARLISLLEDVSCDRNNVMHILAVLASDSEYRHDVAPAIPRLKELLMGSGLDRVGVRHLLSAFAILSEDASYRRDIASVVPRLIDLLQNPDFDDSVPMLLSKLSNYGECRAATKPALALIFRNLNEENAGSYYSVQLIMNHIEDVSTSTYIMKAIPNVAQLLDGRSCYERERAAKILQALSKHVVYFNAIMSVIPKIIRTCNKYGVGDDRGLCAKRTLGVLSENGFSAFLGDQHLIQASSIAEILRFSGSV